MLTVKTMTAEKLAYLTRVGVSAVCLLRPHLILEGQVYLGDELLLTCAFCAVTRARQRVEDARTILNAEIRELQEIESTLLANP